MILGFRLETQVLHLFIANCSDGECEGFLERLTLSLIANPKLNKAAFSQSDTLGTYPDF